MYLPFPVKIFFLPYRFPGRFLPLLDSDHTGNPLYHITPYHIIHVGDARFTAHEVQAIVLITDKKYIAQGIGRLRVRI